jgi:glycerol-3-phosphate O-acyltransferase / dihydroxyacetone phosphate acyltransferase
VWLLRAFPRLARSAAFVYYRVRYTGERVPDEGPVLLVANHPNSLMDPMLVVAAARRPVRFLAKAPLFTDPWIGWLVKAAGAIPVYRRQDDPALMDRNQDAFRAVFDALGRGSVVGIFPEGISHSEPSLVPLKTGAARIAFGGREEAGRAFPIVPVGLVFREKDVFRSDVIVYVGRPVVWEDLVVGSEEGTDATAGSAEPERSDLQAPSALSAQRSALGSEQRSALDSVRELTDRIADALHQVTLNLSRWEDRPLVDFAMRIWEVEFEARADPAERLTRLDVTIRILDQVRRTENPEGLELARQVETQRTRMQRLGLRPADLAADVRLSRGLWWAVRRIHFLLPLALAFSLVGLGVFWVPYRITGLVIGRFDLEEDLRSTYKLLVGAVFHLVWVALLVSVVWRSLGVWPGIAALVLLPLLGVAAQLVRERWRWAWDDARRFFVMRSRRDLVETLRARQREIAIRLNALYKEFATG